jgi:hypothetical protein
MDRRDFLRITTTGASGILIFGTPSCAAIPKLSPSRTRLALPDMDSYLSRVDSGMKSIDGWRPSEPFPEYRGDREFADSLCRKSLRTLYMTAMFSDLPAEGQLHPGMQDRIYAVMPEMDEATSGMEAFLESRSAEELDRLRKALRTSANPAMQIFEAIDTEAARCGVSERRRLQTRWMMTDANFRLRNQPPALVIHQSLDKVRKAAETDITREARADLITGRVAERLFWEEQNRQEPAAKGSDDKSAPDSPPRSKRQRRISRGAKLMGIGVLLGGIAAIGIAADASAFLFVATVGAVFIIIGLITLLVGLATGSGS